LEERLGKVCRLIKLRELDRLALKKHPDDRRKDQTGPLERIIARFDADLKQKEVDLEARVEKAAKASVSDEASATSAAPTWPWGQENSAVRVPILSGVAFAAFLRGQAEETGACKNSQKLEPACYGGLPGRNFMRQAGWHVAAQAEELCPGLCPAKSMNLAPEFRLDPRKEDRVEGLTHLASYVGGRAGLLSVALGELARLLDGGFDGLVIHAVPKVKPPPEFALGMILGPSGSGKTTLAIEHFEQPLDVQWNEEAPALLHFSSLAEARAALSAVDLDLQTAMRPVGLLSSGERERANLARGLAEWATGERNSLVIDEFTSLVDRDVAKNMARGITAFVRSRPQLRGLVLLSCHTDVLGRGLLEPDWLFHCDHSRLLIFDSHAPEAVDAEERAAKRRRMEGGTFARALWKVDPSPAELCRGNLCQSTWERPLVVRRALPCEWKHFREHHYKDHRLSGSSICFVGELDGRAVAFLAAIVPGFTLSWMLSRNEEQHALAQAERLGYPPDWSLRTILREHRTVVLPDSQGLGLGSLMADAVAHLLTDKMGYVFMSTTAHPTYGGYRDRSPLWVALPTSRRDRGDACATFSHIWLGSVRGDGTIDPERERRLRARVSMEGSLMDNLHDEEPPEPPLA
jgi:GNAT superfamily N-acetyltransferase